MRVTDSNSKIQTTHQVIEYLEDLLSARFPYALYKQVFVEKLPEKTSSYASMTLFNSNLLYNERVLDQASDQSHPYYFI